MFLYVYYNTYDFFLVPLITPALADKSLLIYLLMEGAYFVRRLVQMTWTRYYLVGCLSQQTIDWVLNTNDEL